MAVLGLIGSGKASAKMINEGLASRQEAVEGDDDFWFLVAYDGKPSASLSAALKWLDAKEAYYEVVVPSRAKIDDDVIASAAKVHKAADIYKAVVEKLEADEDEDKTLLVLFTEDDDAQNDAVVLAHGRQIPALDLSNALEPFEVEAGEDAEEEEEEEETPPPAARTRAKAPGKVPEPPAKGKPGRPRKAVAEEAVEPEETPDEDEGVDAPEEVEEAVPEPPKTRQRRKPVEDDTPSDVVAKAVVDHQEKIGSDSFAELVANKVVEKLAAALANGIALPF